MNSFQSDLKVFIDSLKLIFPSLRVRFCILHKVAAKRAGSCSTTGIILVSLCGKEPSKNASKQNYNAVKETLHVKWKFMLKLRVMHAY